MSSTCQHCGKPVRPGARFCGSCGSALQEAKAAPSPKAEGDLCPHCGEPVRPDAKFCASCGQSIPTAVEDAVIVAVAASSHDETVTTQEQPPPSEPGDPASDAGIPPSDTPPSKSFFSRYWWLVLLGGLLCVIIITGSILYTQDPFDWQATDTPAAAVVATVTVTETPVQIETDEERTPTESQTPIATTSKTLEPTFDEQTQEASTTPETGTPSLGSTVPLPPTETSTPEIVLEEDFEAGLDENWDVWGQPTPTTSGPNTNKALDLDGDLDMVGVTYKEDISIEPILEISFDAALKDISPDDNLTFYWDPGSESRQPGKRPGPIQVLIGDEMAQLIIVQKNPACQYELPDNKSRTYSVAIGENSSVSFLVDGENVCSVTMQGLPESIGLISYSGRGWVDNVLIVRR